MSIYFSGNGTLVSTGLVTISQGGTNADNSIDAINNLLPAQIGKSGKFLVTDGTNVTWGNGEASYNFTTVTTETSSLSVSTTENISMSLGKSYLLYKIETSHPAWVRIYISDDARLSDASRDINQDPLNITGMVAECITSQDNLNVFFTPSVNGFNGNFLDSTIPIAITNISSQTQIITVNLTIIKLIP